MFTAFHRSEVLAHGASLDTVLAFASGVVDPSLAEDVTIYAEGRVAAVVTSTGHVVRLEAAPAPLTWGVAS